MLMRSGEAWTANQCWPRHWPVPMPPVSALPLLMRSQYLDSPPPLNSSTICAPDKGAHWPPLPSPAAKMPGSKWIPAGLDQIRAQPAWVQSARSTNMFTLSTHFSTNRLPLSSPTIDDLPFCPAPPPQRHLIWTGHFYMWWHTSWQNGEGGKKSHSCAPFCPVINSPDFFLPNL